MGFLPPGYETPTADSGYFKLQPGENRIRALSSAIVGFELWINHKPIRLRFDKFSDEQLNQADVNKFTGKPSLPEHFWAFVVWNYKENKIQIFETTKSSIQRGIEKYISDEEYGSPLGYDLKISKEGSGKETEYSVVASPPKPLNPEIKKVYEITPIRLEALYEGTDPFSTQNSQNEPIETPTDKDLDLDEIDKALGIGAEGI